MLSNVVYQRYKITLKTTASIAYAFYSFIFHNTAWKLLAKLLFKLYNEIMSK